MTLVDRIADGLAHEVRADRPAPQPVALEQRSPLPRVPGLGNRALDVEVIPPARELETVEPPLRACARELLYRQVGPLAGEQGDRSHRARLAHVAALASTCRICGWS